MDIRKVEQIARRQQRTECCGLARGWCTFWAPVYPESPGGERLRRRRMALGISLQDAAAALGIEPKVLTELETGAAVIADPGGWDAALRALGLPT